MHTADAQSHIEYSFLNLFSYHYQDGWTALISASHAWLIHSHVDYFPQDGRAALTIASRKGHVKIVERLLAARAQTDLQDMVEKSFH